MRNSYSNLKIFTNQSRHVWMWKLDCKDSWAPKNWCFWTVLLEKTLESPLTARRSNQSILKEISPGCSSEGLMLKMKLQYFVHLMWRVESLEKTDAGRDWGQEEKGTTEDEMAGWHYWLDGHEFEWTPGLVMDREAWRAVIHEQNSAEFMVSKCQTGLSDWTEDQIIITT